MRTADNRYVPYSIKRAGGIRVHIDTHTKIGYWGWVYARRQGVNVENLARLCGKDRKTVKRWIERDDRENGSLASRKGEL